MAKPAKKATLKSQVMSALESAVFETYVDEVLEIAERVICEHGKVRSREAIRSTVEKYVGSVGVCNGQTLNRRQVVERGLAVGVTKLLEAWDFVEQSGAWPPNRG